MSRSLTDVLHYDISEKRHGELQKSLKEYQLVVKALSEAIWAFETGDLERFDSIVGENACQIRAVRIALMHSYSSIHSDELKRKVAQVLQKIDELLVPNKMAHLMTVGVSLADVLQEYDLNISLSPDELFLLKSYLLTEMKEVEYEGDSGTSLFRKSVCTPVKIKRFNSEISYSFAKSLASHLRQNLASSSVQFVRDAAYNLKDLSLAKMVSDEFLIKHNALDCIPMFWTYKILLQLAHKQDLPLVIHVKFLTCQEGLYQTKGEKFLFFSPDHEGKGASYIHVSPSEMDLSKAACVIQGVACVDAGWNESEILHSVTDAILAGAAEHRQYPDPNQNLPIIDQEHEAFKSMALNRGFSSENPSTFFIQHVYPSHVGTKLSSP